MVQISPINFGLIIAYFLPGILSLYALSYVSDDLSSLFRAAQSSTLNIGALFFLITAAIVSGLIISSLRVVILEPLHYKTGVLKPVIDYAKLVDAQKLSLYKEVVDNVYRYYQFYGNIMISLLFLFTIRYLILGLSIFDTRQHFTLFAINTIAIILLFFSSRRSLKDVCKTTGDICR